MALSSEDIRLIVQTLQASEWDQAEVVVGDVRIAVARNGAALDAPAPTPTLAPTLAPTPNSTVSHGAQPSDTVGHRGVPAAAPVAGPAAPASNGTVSHGGQPSDTVGHRDIEVEGHTVTAPSVGVFWRAPEPGAAPFVKVGSVVAAGDTIGIVEVMKLMSNITTDVAGTVVAVHAENAEGVQFGTPLVTVRPEA